MWNVTRAFIVSPGGPNSSHIQTDRINRELRINASPHLSLTGPIGKYHTYESHTTVVVIHVDALEATLTNLGLRGITTAEFLNALKKEKPMFWTRADKSSA
jgi:hypothetical protein